uniref:Uncharacterized protein n=1 Tax=Lygus hesperus TaxID=30085 RepID=A0A0A9W6G0_LYGHE
MRRSRSFQRSMMSLIRRSLKLLKLAKNVPLLSCYKQLNVNFKPANSQLKEAPYSIWKRRVILDLACNDCTFLVLGEQGGDAFGNVHNRRTLPTEAFFRRSSLICYVYQWIDVVCSSF